MTILFLVTEDSYFWTHRLGLARKVLRAGAEVTLMTHLNKHGDAIRKEGFKIIPWDITRGSLNPLREFAAFLQVWRVYRRMRPDLVHHVALKPLVHGGLAARICGDLPAVNTVAGLGEVFIGQSKKMLRVRRVLLRLLRLALKGPRSRTIVQNDQNRAVFLQERIVADDQLRVIQGSGVDPDEFAPAPEPQGTPVVLLACRMLWTKGVGEFVEAAAMLRRRNIAARFVLVGDSDAHNPSGIPVAQLQAWAESGAVEWWGHRDEMAPVFAQAAIVCLPSHGEGLPKVLIEAGACARATIATDTPGCRDVVRHGENGLLVPIGDAAALAEAVSALLEDSALRARMGARAREIVVKEFSEDKIFREIFAVYRELLGPRWPEREAAAALSGAARRATQGSAE